MSRADQARRRQQDEARDRVAHARPNVPPTPFDPDPEAWESHCAGNRSGLHLVVAKAADRWRCGSCTQWLRPPVRRGGTTP